VSSRKRINIGEYTVKFESNSTRSRSSLVQLDAKMHPDSQTSRTEVDFRTAISEHLDDWGKSQRIPHSSGLETVR
jgi:hypothetical protein